MKEETIEGITYKLPGSLNEFQKEMYVHLIKWKWLNISEKPGIYTYRKKDLKYDAILPKREPKNENLIYSTIRTKVEAHQEEFKFKYHIHFNHMASSQAANINLFLPLLLHPATNSILAELDKNLNLNLNFMSLATDHLDDGFKIEYWAETPDGKGLLGDHNARSGTDSDIAIAYNNNDNQLCLWLIEHKLTEKEFTQCGGAKSENRNSTHDCTRLFSEILKNKDLCYYQSTKKARYWDITETNQSFFSNHHKFDSCPFISGINQLWRNQLLGLALEEEKTYKHVVFSVVKHPGNTSLDNTIEKYKELIAGNKKFSVFTSADVLSNAERFADKDLKLWIDWYKTLYNLK